MSIVSSVIANFWEQSDGSGQVEERHTDSAGKVHSLYYRAAAGADRDAILAVHATNLAAELAEQEADEVMRG